MTAHAQNCNYINNSWVTTRYTAQRVRPEAAAFSGGSSVILAPLAARIEEQLAPASWPSSPPFPARGGVSSSTAAWRPVTYVRTVDDGRTVPAIHFLGLGSKLGCAGRLPAHPTTLSLASIASDLAAYSRSDGLRDLQGGW